MSPSIQTAQAEPHTVGFIQRQLPTIREMLASLDTLTIAGRQHQMAKVVRVIRNWQGDEVGGPGRGNRRMVVDLLDNLALESERPLPNPRDFAVRAESLVALLAASA